MSEEMDLNYSQELEEELNETNININQIETKIVFKTNSDKSDPQISINEEELQSIYHSYDINLDQLNRKYSVWRLDVIHIRGVENMSSEEVLKYFESFEPNSIEWVNDLSCNVVFSDPKASAIAIKCLTTALVVKGGKDQFAATDGLTCPVIDANSLSVPVPPGFRWRLGVTHLKSKALLLRFATNSDKKVKNSRSMSEYYLKYGVSGDISPKDSVNVRKRAPLPINSESDFELSSKRIRMRMRADDEQELMRNRVTTGAQLGEQVHNSVDDYQHKSIWDRLDNDSFGNYCAVDKDLLEIAIDNQSDDRKPVWKERPLRSTISVIGSKKNTSFNRNDLRTKISKRKSY